MKDNDAFSGWLSGTDRHSPQRGAWLKVRDVEPTKPLPPAEAELHAHLKGIVERLATWERLRDEFSEGEKQE